MDDEVFAVAGGDHEFVGGVTADGAAFGFYGEVFESAAFEDAAVGFVHGIVGGVELFDGGAEAVGILHEEFAGAEDSEAWPFFVAEFGLDLIEGDWQLSVAADVACDEVGDDFFVSGAEGEVESSIAAFGFEVEEYISEGFAASGAFEDFDGLECGHKQFDGSGTVHLFADDIGDFADGAVAEWKPGVGAGHELADES
ncbi:MAG: hypothetical protein RL215_3338 [Planctomycetota bacterium]